MAIHVSDVVETTGFQRRTNKGAERMLFDNLQKGQYVYPVKSTVRELVSNGIDSINEKEIARKILSGESKESEYYYVPGTNPAMDAAIEANTGEYEDSRFDADYYDLTWLDLTSNRVLIKYLESDNTQRDRVQIIDYGVGLSPRRLEGILELGYSTKRLAKSPLGKFGLGAKVALSTGIDFYTLNTNYNGRFTSFNVYGHNAYCNTPPFDADGNNEVAYFSYDDEKKHPYHWKSTDQKNGVMVEFEIKKHRKQELLAAVKAQLLYFPNVDLQVVHSDGYTSNEQVQADVIYEDDKIVISNNTQFSKPHIVINNVSYGYIDFLELETEERQGNVGVKFQPQELEVSPSRESVMWTEKTGAAVRQRFKDVEDIASDYITKSMDEKDFITWWGKAKALTGLGNSNDRVIEAFRKLVDITTIRPTFFTPEGIAIKFGPLDKMAPFLKLVKITKRTVYKGGEEIQKIDRESASSFSPGEPIYIKSVGEKFKFHTDLYLLTEVHSNGFYTLTYEETEDLTTLRTDDEEWDDKRKADRAKLLEVNRFIAKQIAPLVEKDRYENLSTPDKYAALDKKGKDSGEDDSDEVKISNEDRRLLSGSIPAKLLGIPYSVHGLSSVDGFTRYFEHKQEELKLADIKELSDSDEETYYSTSKHNELLHLAATICRPFTDHQHFYTNDNKFVFWGASISNYVGISEPIRFLEVSQDNQRKHGHAWNHITTFFKRFNPNTGIISMSSHLIRWNTARLIHQHIESIRFLENFGMFDQEKVDTYKKLSEYHVKNWRPFSGVFNGGYGSKEEVQTELISYLENLADLQMCVASGLDQDSIVDKVKDLFPEDQDPDKVKGAQAVDLDILNDLNELLAEVEPYKVLLNNIRPLLDPDAKIPADMELEIRAFINFKTGN